MNSRESVEAWIGKRDSFYFFLPDGPYGRPFDNQYTVKEIQWLDDGCNVIFSDEISLCFVGLIDFVEEINNLVIRNFSQCLFKINGSVIDAYSAGEVTLAGF